MTPRAAAAPSRQRAAGRGARRAQAARCVVITGLSGSGKSAAVKAFEDLGAFCVDNLPTALLPQMLAFTRRGGEGAGLVVLGMDIRERHFLEEFPRTFRRLRTGDVPLRLLFFEASEQVLVRRFSESRRVHPLGRRVTLLEALRAERRRMEPVRALADEVIDTSTMRVRELRARLAALAQPRRARRTLLVTILSFGYKHGVPVDADLVLDVRFVANPFFEEGLRHRSGLDEPVREFVLGRPECRDFVARALPFLGHLMPRYRDEGRAYLTVAVGCTGGRHRSPVIARELAAGLERLGWRVEVRDRDILGE